MNIDIRTLTLILSITDALLVGVFFFQFILNNNFRGQGWWVLGLASLSIGVFLLLMRDFITIRFIYIILANSMIIMGGIFLYIGIMRFLEKKENLRLILSVMILFLSSYFYFTYVNDNISVRTGFLSAAIAILALFGAQSLLTYKTRYIKASAFFNAVVFLSYGCLIVIRAVVVLTYIPVTNIFTPGLMQTAFFLGTFIYHIILTFGLIIMVNQRLNGEMREARNEQRLIFNSSPGAALITRLSDGIYVDSNDKFTELTGYKREELVGTSSLEINFWEKPAERDIFTNELRKNGFCKNMEASLHRKDGMVTTAIMSANIITLQGIPHILSITSDISERKREEEQIQSLLKDKELLLKEVHHRVKNNMNTINSLLYLQSNNLKEPSAVAALHDAASRVQSMAILYDKLYQSSNFKSMSISNYLTPLIEDIVSYFPKNIPVKIEKNIGDFQLPAETLFPLGIITNELITNIMKYAFAGRDDRLITVSAEQNKDQTKIIIKDNGIGISKDFNPKNFNPENSTGFGLKLVGLLTKQLEGTLRIESDNGTKFILEFDTPK